MTSGPTSNHYSLFAASNNPAMASFMVDENEKWRTSYSPSLGFSFEIGDVNNFVDELDELIDLIDDSSSNQDPVEEVLDRFNTVLNNMGDQGYIKSTNWLSAPLFPLFYKPGTVEGTFFAELSAGTQIGVRILDDPLTYDEQNSSFATATSVYLKSGLERRLSLGYSRELPLKKDALPVKGKLHGGFRFNVIGIELSKQIIPIQLLDGQDIEDVIEDEYDSNLISSTEIGLDVGLVLDTEKYRVGLSIANLLSPTFEYGTIGEGCELREEDTIPRSNCEATAYFIQVKGELKASEKHTRHPITTVDTSYFLSKKWIVSAALDLATYDDTVGFENQWFHVATSYQPDGKWKPASRIGFQKNLAGSEISSFTIGFTFFNALTLDIEWGLESVTIDGNTGPRRVGFAVGLEERF